MYLGGPRKRRKPPKPEEQGKNLTEKYVWRIERDNNYLMRERHSLSFSTPTRKGVNHQLCVGSRKQNVTKCYTIHLAVPLKKRPQSVSFFFCFCFSTPPYTHRVFLCRHASCSSWCVLVLTFVFDDGGECSKLLEKCNVDENKNAFWVFCFSCPLHVGALFSIIFLFHFSLICWVRIIMEGSMQIRKCCAVNTALHFLIFSFFFFSLPFHWGSSKARKKARILPRLYCTTVSGPAGVEGTGGAGRRMARGKAEVW